MKDYILKKLHGATNDSLYTEFQLKCEDYRKKYITTDYQLQNLYNYQRWIVDHQLSSQELINQQRQAKMLAYKPLVSVLIPVYKTPIALLRDCLESVASQTYPNWQICVVDDASKDAQITALLEHYKKKYGVKFSYRTRSANGHISLASNDALELADGEYVALLDHDDVLWPNALYETVSRLNQDRLIDVIYTDEDKLEQGVVHSHPYLKPGFSPTFLSGCNYITHFTLIRTQLARTVGGFRKGLEGAQDWDLFLRLSLRTERIVHLPQILYSWRVIDSSTAQRGFDAKPYAYEAQRRAVTDYYREKGIAVRDVVLPAGYIGWMVHFDIPLVTLTVVFSDYSSMKDITRLIAKFEESKGENIAIGYVLTGSQSSRIIIDNPRVSYIDKSTIPSLTTDYVFCVSGVFDIQGEAGWLENIIGYRMLQGVQVVTALLRYSDHTVVSAGIVYDRLNNRVNLLEGYSNGCDQRLDTGLASPREAQFPDSRLFLCKPEDVTNITGVPTSSHPHVKTIVTPFVNFFVQMPLDRPQYDPNLKDFSYDLPLDNPYWGSDYINQSL